MTTNWCGWTVILLKFYITACNSSLHNYGKAKTDLHWLAKIFIRRVFGKALWLIRNSHWSLLGPLFSLLDPSGWSWFRPGGKDRYTVAGKDTSGLPAPPLIISYLSSRRLFNCETHMTAGVLDNWGQIHAGNVQLKIFLCLFCKWSQLSI